MLSAEDIKKKVGTYAAGLVEPGMIIGLGTGTTAHWLILELGSRVKQGLQIRVVPTSEATRQLATGLAIPIVDLNEVEGLDLTIDGADEIDRDGQCIKGGGGALLQEKIVAGASGELIIIAGSSKLVNQLGKYPLPVEVIPFGYRQVQKQVLHSGLCRKANLRLDRGKPFVTDHYHYILDCECDKIEDAASFNSALHNIPGVVETGLFVNMARRAIIGYADGRIETINFNRNN